MTRDDYDEPDLYDQEDLDDLDREVAALTLAAGALTGIRL